MKLWVMFVLGTVSWLETACSDSSDVVATMSDAGAVDSTAEIAEIRADRSTSEMSSSDEAAPSTPEAAPETGAGAVQLFNGGGLGQWETYLGAPFGATDPIGSGSDPRQVFSVVQIDGAPAIRVSGEVWGALITRQEFGNYHLRAEYKWGTHAVWPPLSFRDSGLMYHAVGPNGAVKAGGGALADPPLSGYFMTSMEVQIAEGDVGSYASLGPISVEGGPFYVAASGQYEHALGAWNTVDVYVVGNDAAHLVNDHLVVQVKNATLAQEDGGRVPLTKGKIQLESESMEIYFRSISLIPIDRIPDRLPEGM